jgi:hypothetical protein
LRNSPFIHDEPVTPPIFVGRERELEMLRNCILTRNESVTISGYDAIGKSSLILTFMSSLEKNEAKLQHDIYPVRIHGHQLYQGLTNDFLSVITHELCASIWTKVFKNKYSALLEDTLLYSRGNDLSKKHETLLKRIFRIVTSDSITSAGKIKSEFGGRLVIQGSVGEENSLSLQRKPLQSFEFMLLLDELMEILEDHGFQRIVVLCDELNHLPPKVNYDLISTYLDVFSSKKIMFLISAVDIKNTHMHPDRVDMGDLLNSFSNQIRLKKIDSSSDIDVMIKNSIQCAGGGSISFIDGCSDKIFEITEGFPWFSVKLCNEAYSNALKHGENSVDLASINKFVIPFSRAITKYNRDEGSFQRWSLESQLRSVD